MNDQEYGVLVQHLSEPSPMVRNSLLAFAVGGGICVLGQILRICYAALGFGTERAGTWATITLIFLSALLTGLDLYDDLAKHAGAGTLVPVTGFANSIVAPAMDFKSEGFVSGMAAKMFIIAGPVLVFGVGSSVIYGLVYWLLEML